MGLAILGVRGKSFGLEHVRVVDDGEVRTHSFVPHLERLGLLGQYIEGFAALSVDRLLVRDHVLVADPTVRADLVERDLAALQQLHEERSRDVEHVRCVLGRQLGVDRDDADRVASGDVPSCD